MSPLLTWIVVFAGLMALNIARAFYVACIRGTKLPQGSAAAPFELADRAGIPSVGLDRLDELDSDIVGVGATHLGYLSKPILASRACFSAWVLDDGDALVLGTVATTADGERVTLSFVDVCSELVDGTELTTNNWDSLNAKDSDRHRIRSFPAWMDGAALVEIHRARLRSATSRARPFAPDLQGVIERDAESTRRSGQEWSEAVGKSRDGRYRVPMGEFARALMCRLPVVGTIVRVRRNARRWRELRDMGVGHLAHRGA